MTGASMFQSIVILLAIAVSVSTLCRLIRLPVIVGYLLVGMLVGPFGLGWVGEVQTIQHLAEFGVVFLLFTVGLEFSLTRLIALRKTVFGMGLLQVVGTLLITTLIGQLVGVRFIMAFIIGAIVAMSSTAIVSKILTDRLEIAAQHGTNAIGILLFQDLAVVPFLILIASLGTLTTHATPLIATNLLWALIKGLFAIGLILSMGRWLLRPLFHYIASTRILELFTLTVLLVTLGAAWFTNMMGLSLALGAFLAGIMLGETEYRHQIEVEIRPFRDVLLGLFFISIGMLLNVHGWGETWPWILLLVMALLFGKFIFVVILARIFGNDEITSIRTGIVLAQGGEFGFALLTLALSQNVLPETYGQVILGGLLISIALAPLAVYYNREIAELILPKSTKYDLAATQQAVKYSVEKLRKPVIICGFGRVGQNIARIIEKANIDFLALDTDPLIVQNAKLAGEHITFGDATHPEILKATNLHRASAVVISIANQRSIIKILSAIRRVNKLIPIIVRCRDETQFEALQTHGATKVIVETFEESFMLAYGTLVHVDVPNVTAAKIIHDVRTHHYDLLQQVYPGKKVALHEESIHTSKILKPFIIQENIYAVGKTLSKLNLESVNVRVVSIAEKQGQHKRPKPSTIIRAEDVLVLYGSPTNIQRAENILISKKNL